MGLPSLRKMVWGGLGLFFFGLGIYSFLAGSSSGNLLIGGFSGILAIFFGVIAGIIFAFTFLGDISSFGTNFLIGPRRFLKKAPPLTGQIEALIKQEKFEAALKRVDEMLKEYPDVVRLHVAKFDLLAVHFERPEAALAAAEAFFRRPKRIVSEENAMLLLRYAELARAVGKEGDAEMMLQSELKRRRTGYTRLERERLTNALEQNSTVLPR